MLSRASVFLAFFDQAAIELDQRGARFEIEHGVKVLFEQLAALGVRCSRIEIFGPIALHPGLD